jgi:hypothetical protein
MSAGHLRMLDKQRELQAFMTVEAEGARLRTYLDTLGDKINILEQGTQGKSIRPFLFSFFLIPSFSPSGVLTKHEN